MVLIEIGLTALVGIIIFVAWWWAKGQHEQALIPPEALGRHFFLGASLGGIALSSVIMVFLFGFAPVDAVLLSSLIMFIMIFGARKYSSGKKKGQ